jgi:hypothetical protein
MEPCAAVNGTPIARRTCEGSSEPDVQAEPEEAQSQDQKAEENGFSFTY